jgi:hypothetical protein
MAASLSIDGGTGVIGYYDTLAQSFYVDSQMHATKIDLFFSGVDDAAPVELSIRNIENGTPSSNILVNSVVVKAVSDITTSTDGSTATTFTFPIPVILDKGQYCFTLSSSSSKNRLFVSTLGANDLVTGARISKNSLAGILFVSSDGLNWSGDQTRDIKFTLYRAKFSSQNAVIDLAIDGSKFTNPTSVILPKEPFRSYTGSAVVKVTHPNHGFVNTNYVNFNGVPGWLDYLTNPSNVTATSTLNYIPVQYLANTDLVVSNVTSDTYTVILGANSYFTGNITAGQFGGPAVSATSILPYSVLQPAISSFVPSKTNMVHKLQTINEDYEFKDFAVVDPNNIEFKDKARVLLDNKNSSAFAGGKSSLTYRLQITSTDEYVSPVIDTKATGLVFVTPEINNPSVSDTIALDYNTIASANTNISFSRSSTITTVSIGKADTQANARIIVPGSNVVISGCHANNAGDFRVTGVAVDGKTLYVKNPYGITEPTGNAVTIVYKPSYIDEHTAKNSSSKAKYITRKISLANYSTAILVRFAISTPPGTNAKAYFKVQGIGEEKSFANKEFTGLDLSYLNDTVDGQFIDVEKYVNNIQPFNAFVLKIVLNSDSIAYYPKVKDLRVIALA